MSNKIETNRNVIKINNVKRIGTPLQNTILDLEGQIRTLKIELQLMNEKLHDTKFELSEMQYLLKRHGIE